MTNTKFTQEQLIEKQLILESIANNENISKARTEMERQIRSKAEYNLSYGKDAVVIIIEKVEAYIKELFGLKNQHNKKFYWDKVKPSYEAYTERKAAVKALEKAKAAELKKKKAGEEYSEELLNERPIEIGEDPIEVIANITAIKLVGGLSRETTLTKIGFDISKSAMHALKMELHEREEYSEQAFKFFEIIVLHISETTDLFKTEQINNREYVIKVSDEWKEIIDTTCKEFGNNAQAYRPMIVKPLPHTSLTDSVGGYLTSRSPLMKHPHREDGKIFSAYSEFNAETYPEFFEIHNRMQEIPYCVNTKLLEVLRDYYGMGYSFTDFPVIEREELVEEQAQKEIDTRNTKRQEYAAKYSTEYTPLAASTVAKVFKSYKDKEKEATRKTESLLEQAEFYSQFEEIFYPIFIDHRGRRYPYSTAGLSYQGDEMAKALVHFANKEEINEDGMEALLETLGNALGFDKKHVDVKVQLAKNWWAGNRDAFFDGDFSIFFKNQGDFDEPITALAITLELIEILKDPSYKTGIIVHRDARVSGSSIIGTILRDKSIMQLTSVIDTDNEDLPDGYSFVSGKALDYTVAMADAGDKLAQEILEFSDELFTRKVFKHVVMTSVSYGLTDYSLRKYNSGVFNWDEKLSFAHKAKFDAIMIDTLKQALPSCSRYLEEIEKVGKLVAKRDGKVFYKNPITQFPVVFHSFKETKRKVDVNTGFTRIQLVINSKTDKTDNQAIAREMAPSVIHNLDSTTLYLVNKYLPDVETAMIHDSVGVSPNNVKKTIGAYAKAMCLFAVSDVFSKIANQLNVEDTITPEDTCTKADISSILNSRHILT
ncbi:MAG: DNA-directed RNA polymerase [Cetobacterium sp.]